MLELARPDDREAVNRLAAQVHSAHVGWRPDLYEEATELFDEARFSELISAREMYVARMEGVVVGYAYISVRTVDHPGLVRRRVLLLSELCVEECLRDHGIGSRMMADIKALARAFGCRDIQLSVYPQNDEAVSFYQKNGLMIQSINMQMKA